MFVQEATGGALDTYRPWEAHAGVEQTLINCLQASEQGTSALGFSRSTHMLQLKPGSPTKLCWDVGRGRERRKKRRRGRRGWRCVDNFRIFFLFVLSVSDFLCLRVFLFFLRLYCGWGGKERAKEGEKGKGEKYGR